MKEKSNIFQIIEGFIEAEINEKSVDKLLKIERNKFIELIEWIRFENRCKHWFVDNDELPKPKLTIKQAILTDSEGNSDSYEIWNETDKLKTLLLYYPSIAVLDPIDETLNLAAEAPNVLIKHLKKLFPLRQLIEQNIIDLVPAVTGGQAIREQIELSSYLEAVLSFEDISDLLSAINLHSPDYFKIIEESDLNLPMMSLSEKERNVIEEIFAKRKGETKKGLIVLTAMIIKELIVQNELALLNNSNLGLVSKNQVNFFKRLGGLEFKHLESLGDSSDLKSEFLINMQMPKIEGLSWTDLINLRNDDKDFYTWRNALKEVLRESQKGEVYDTNKFLINAKETMIAQSRYLESEIKEKKSLKNKIKNASVQTGIGFIGGILTGSIEMALLGSGVSGSLQLIHDLFTNKASKGEQALYKHFSLFLDN